MPIQSLCFNRCTFNYFPKVIHVTVYSSTQFSRGPAMDDHALLLKFFNKLGICIGFLQAFIKCLNHRFRRAGWCKQGHPCHADVLLELANK